MKYLYTTLHSSLDLEKLTPINIKSRVYLTGPNTDLYLPNDCQLELVWIEQFLSFKLKYFNISYLHCHLVLHLLNQYFTYICIHLFLISVKVATLTYNDTFVWKYKYFLWDLVTVHLYFESYLQLLDVFHKGPTHFALGFTTLTTKLRVDWDWILCLFNPPQPIIHHTFCNYTINHF